MNQTLKRTITALILLGIAVGSALLGVKYFIYFIHIVILLMQFETGKLLFKVQAPQLVIPFTVQGFVATLIFNYLPGYFLPFLFLITALSIAFILVLYSERANADHLKIISLYTMGFAYVGLLPSLTTKLLMSYQGAYWLIICLGVVLAGDVAAYFVGRKFGKNKLIPTISPNKTWEGSLGGLAASIIIGVILGYFLLSNVNLFILGISSAVASVLAQSGDFFESLIKRVAGEKDSGSLLPGHGGFLDRFDGFLFALPVFYYIAN
jgi:phosphatidate cytidylyltransferase